MELEHTDIETVDTGALIEDLFGLDPAELAKMAPAGRHKNDPPLLGLQAILRRALMLVLQIRGERDVSLRLAGQITDPAARAENLIRLLAFVLVREWRFYNALPFLALEDAQPNAVSTFAPPSDLIAKMSILELLKEVLRAPDRSRGEKDFSERYPVSICEMVTKMLRLDPRQVRDRFTDHADRAEAAFAENPEAQTRLGLEELISDAKYQYKVMLERNTDRIRLMGEEDARIAHRPNARMANMITVLSAAFLADEQHVITFEPPRPRPVGEEEMLRAAAKLVYLDNSYDAERALELLCDRIVHFGSFDRFPRSQELLAAVREECDPKMERMPFGVAVQEVGFKAFAAAGPGGKYTSIKRRRLTRRLTRRRLRKAAAGWTSQNGISSWW